MNRTYFGTPKSFLPGEFLLFEQEGVRIYNGNDKTGFENGLLSLTSHRLIWSNPSVLKEKTLCLDLVLIYLTEEEAGTFLRSDKIICHLSKPPEGKPPGPRDDDSSSSFIKLSFKSGGQKSFISKLTESLSQQQWQVKVNAPIRRPHPPPTTQKKMRSGIGGIERSRIQKAKETDTTISKAFTDLDQLIDMAKPMVALAKSISGQIRDKQGEVSEDETIKFKSYLLSLGISDPVTRESHGSGQTYFKQLAKEIFLILEQPIKEAGGMITLTDAFCRVNRARGMELLSPEDLLNACRALKSVNLPMSLKVFDSGVRVLVTAGNNDEEVVRKTGELFEVHESLTAEEMSRMLGLSLILAKERLLAAENKGLLCRDDTIEGLRFYKNRFLLTA